MMMMIVSDLVYILKMIGPKGTLSDDVETMMTMMMMMIIVSDLVYILKMIPQVPQV